MWAYIVRRVLMGLVLLLALTLVTFILFFASRSIPRGSPAARTAPRSSSDVTRARRSATTSRPTSSGRDFIKGVVVGRDFPVGPGASQQAAPAARDPLRGAVPRLLPAQRQDGQRADREAAPVSISLAIVALVMWLIGGVLFGILAAVTKGSFLDRGIVGMTLIAYAFPTFFIAVFLLKYVVVKWGIFAYPSYSPIEEGRACGPGSATCSCRPSRWRWSSWRLRPDDPRVRARVAERGLHPDREGQGPAAVEQCCSSTGCGPP